jgi:sarcosine oxidase subunit delta
MIINHPLLGPRDASEFTYLGDASVLMRPDGHLGDASEKIINEVHDFVHLRDNPAGLHRELWYHEHGDRSWLVVTRNTITHEIVKVELARDVKRRKEVGNG